jgi:pimeloyl-ACP methyl ester carboxylesterase
MMKKSWIRNATAVLAILAASAAHCAGVVGNTLPPDFPVIEDTSLGKPIIGFGAAGPVGRTPVIFVHGNNDTPFPTTCNPFGSMQALAQYLANNGYSTSELWGLGYQGDQCDLGADQTLRSRIAHTNAANVPDLRRFIRAVMAYTGADEVDIVGHSLGVTIAREWIRQDDAQRVVRRLVAIDGPNHGIINCSPDPANYFQLPAAGGFTPSSEVCQELGSPRTPFLRLLNGSEEVKFRDSWHGDSWHGDRHDFMDRPTVLVIRNADASFVYFPIQDGAIGPVPAVDSFGQPTDFSKSARIRGAREIALTGQGAFDPVLHTSHLGILNSPQTWQATLEFLSERHHRGH